jgi:hypothetical protein
MKEHALFEHQLHGRRQHDLFDIPARLRHRRRRVSMVHGNHKLDCLSNNPPECSSEPSHPKNKRKQLWGTSERQ